MTACCTRQPGYAVCYLEHLVYDALLHVHHNAPGLRSKQVAGSW